MTDGLPMWTVTIPAPCEWLTANDRRHRLVQAKLIKIWRMASATYARQARLPTGLAKVRIDAVVRFAGRPPVRDTGNLEPTLKAVVDGLGPARTISRTDRATGVRRRFYSPGYGLVPDDDARHVDGPHIEIGDPLPAQHFGPSGQLILTIRQLQP